MTSPVDHADASEPVTPTFGELLWAWTRIGFLSFGGPAAQIALMHREIVDERKWLTERQYLNALSFCMLLPGPEAMQIATYTGWRIHGVAGGLAAGLLFVLPGAGIVLALAILYALFGDVPLVNALFLGVKAAVMVIVVEALMRVAKRALSLPEHWVLAGAAFVAIFFLDLPFPLIILVAALIGFFRASRSDGHEPAPPIKHSIAGTVTTAVTWLAIWIVPLALVWVIAADTILPEIGLFFSKLAVVTFGGAYAVLAYMAQDVVDGFGWLTAGQMMDGLGLAETTPGPLILVTEFVGFLAARREGGLAWGVAGALVTLWATFAPCFLWIFVGAPYIDWIATQPRLRGALTGITAAVVGVILNLTIWFALHVIFAEVTPTRYGPVQVWQPDITTFDWKVIVLSLVCAVLLFQVKWGIARVLGIAAALGVVLTVGLE